MIEWLTNLPKVIDAFIVGVIELLYRFAGAVITVTRRPLAGARALEQQEDQLSSRTMLFGAVALFVSAGFFNVSNVASISGVGLFHFSLMIIVIYIALDSLSVLGARYCAARQQGDPADRVRDFLRYGFAASAVLGTVCIVAIQAINGYITSFGPNPFLVMNPALSLPLSLAVVALILILLVVFYHPVAIVRGLAGPAGAGFGRTMVTGLLSLVLTALVGAFLTLFLTSYFYVNKLTEGTVVATPVSCQALPAGVRLGFVVENASPHGTYLSHRTLALRVTYPAASGAAGAPLSETIPLSRIDGDVALIEARAGARMLADARSNTPAYRAFVASKGTGTCQLTAGQTRRNWSLDETAPLEPAAAALTGAVPPATSTPAP